MAKAVGHRMYSCHNCGNNVSYNRDLLSKTYVARSGQAFLFSRAMNITMGPKEDRLLVTGIFTIAEIYCVNCNEVLGWKYERAYEESQKYKEGKFVLERAKIVEGNSI